MTVLAVLKPATHRAVDVENDRGKTLPVSAVGLGPNRVFEFLRALLAWPARAALEVVTEKVKAARLLSIHETGFVRMQLRPRLRGPLPDLLQGPLGFLLIAAQDHEVISIAHHLVSCLGHDLVQWVEREIREQGTAHAANNVAKRGVEFFIRLSREHLRPTYGQGFRGAPLQTDTEEPRPQTIRPGGSRAKVTQTTSEVSRSEEEI